LKERKGFELRPEGNNKWFCEREKNGYSIAADRVK